MDVKGWKSDASAGGGVWNLALGVGGDQDATSVPVQLPVMRRHGVSRALVQAVQ